ncbi:MAG TPA: glucose-6-phosphate dehydrogenase (NADP(+)), partial [Actinobacteria bacterium]|nr:glucose-6-phosphate dehydrogenase (NADP(+)) [Actinomycetota bacterium]
YYEHAGALRDMVQSHLTQVMTLVAMEPPASLEADSIRNEKVKVLQSIQRIDPEQVVVGRYGPGTSNGSPVGGYLEEEGVAADSTTGTFVAMRVDIDNWRWQGVPFYLRTGKRLPRRLTQIAIEFYEPPVCLFDREGLCQVHSNTLVITLQPHEGFELLFDVKAPEERFRLITLPLDFFYEEAFGPLPAAYTTLIKDLLSGDQTLFVRADEVEESWRLFTPLLARSGEPDPYPAGSWGPEASERLPARDGNAWVVR